MTDALPPSSLDPATVEAEEKSLGTAALSAARARNTAQRTLSLREKAVGGEEGRGARGIRWYRSLRTRVVLVFLVPALLTLGSLITYASLQMRDGLEAELGQRLSSIGQAATALLSPQIVASFLPEDRDTRSYRNLQRRLQRLKESTGVRRIFVFDHKRRSLLDTEEIPIGQEYVHLSFERSEIGMVWRRKLRASVLFQDEKGQLYKTGFAPLEDEKGQVIAVIGVEGSASYFQILRRTQRSMLLFALLSLGLVVLSGFLFSRWVVAPVRRLVQATEAIGQGRLQAEVPRLQQDEIGVLARTMEEMRCNILARDRQMQMMLSGIAHEVRNPLGGMELFTGILDEELAEQPELRSHVRRIQRELRYLAEVVQSFLEYARPTSLDLRIVDWEDFSQELRILLAADLEKKKISLRLQGDSPSKTLQFDRTRMQQALLNLLQNAIHASPEKSEVILQIAPDEEGACLQIIDHGAGMSPQVLEKILEPFYTTKEKGTGLGLPLAAKIIERHGGALDIHSIVGEGTTLSIWLPAEPPPQEEATLLAREFERSSS
jgi:signal transduction histidine kinase